MNEFKFSDYDIFNKAVSTISTCTTAINSAQEISNTAKAVISDNSKFMGPVQESCMEGFHTVDSDFQTLKTQLEALSNYLKEASEKYKAGDSKAEDTVVSSTGGTTTTTTTGTSNGKMSIPSDPAIAEKKRQYIGDVDDPSQYTEYQGNNLFGRRNVLTLFDNTTGEIIQDHGTITLKPGETRVITVKLPTDTGMINQITRTTADGDGNYRSGRIVTSRSDIDPDPNNVDYVRIVEGKNGSYHQPSDMSLLHNNSYDWIITANAEGQVKASQTCLWSSSMTNGRNLKAMINLNVQVKS